MGELCRTLSGELIRRDERPQLVKSSLANAVDDQQVFGFSKRAVAFAMFDDFRSNTRSDLREFLKVADIRGVDIDRGGGSYGVARIRRAKRNNLLSATGNEERSGWEKEDKS